METIHIACITDESYAMPTGVTLVSLKKNKAERTKVEVHILCNHVSPVRMRQFEELRSDDFGVELIDVTEKKLPRDIEPLTEHVSLTALYKFCLPSVFEQLDRILYIDGDLIIQEDITSLYNTNIDELFAAVVKDMAPMRLYQPTINERLNIEHTAYFNSGVMLLNLKKMREEAVEKKLMDYRMYGINFFMDQDASMLSLRKK